MAHQNKTTQKSKPILLMILDGWGYSEQQAHNPTQSAATPTIDRLFKEHPYTLIEASGTAVCLPEGQIGNSEVGHLHIGSGRKVPQDLTRINTAITDQTFQQNPAFLNAIAQAKQNNSAIHIMGLCSPGGVHSHQQHLITLIQMIAEQGVNKHYCHAILDGRDVPPRSALATLTAIQTTYDNLGSGAIASVIGRYYAMDRDRRWERTQKAYDLLTLGQAEHHYDDPCAALEQAYARGENDEFVGASSIHPQNDKPITINDGDIVIFMNYRADRARQISQAFTDPDFSEFKREKMPQLGDYVTLTEYAKTIPASVAFPPATLPNTLGEWLAKHELHQLRIAETEKYAHVTYFFNGGAEQAFPHEDRQLIPSPKVATYDLQPEMSADILTSKLCQAIESLQYDVIICNYANPDMIGHTGHFEAAEQAMVMIDDCLNTVLSSLQKIGGELLVTADHGNIETMFNPDNNQAHTAHTTNLVPLIYVGRSATFTINDGALDDVAPTLLYLLGLKPADEMTGRNLLTLSNE